MISALGLALIVGIGLFIQLMKWAGDKLDIHKGSDEFDEWMVDVGLRKSATEGRVAVPEDDEEGGGAKGNVK